MKRKPLSPLDQSILALATEFSKIPDYEKKMEDEDLRKVHAFIAAGILGIHDAKNMIIASFIPAANKMVVRTRAQIQQSTFKNIFSDLQYDPNTIQHETIRLGYVFVFHKFEVFVNDLLDMMDNILDEEVIPLRKYAKSKFDFNPNEWFRNSAVHLVNFISNCTKHQDGRCRLYNPNHTFPTEFKNYPTGEKIVRTTQQFKTDIQELIDAINPIIQIVTSIFLHRTLDSVTGTMLYESNDSMHKAGVNVAKMAQETLIRINMMNYYR